MSTIITAGNSIILKSDLKLTTLQRLAKYRPSALMKLDDKKNLVFKVDVAASGDGSVSEKAVYFAPVSHDKDGKAIVTIAIPVSCDKVKEYAADLLAAPKAGLDAMEADIKAAAASVDEERKALMDAIVAQ